VSNANQNILLGLLLGGVAAIALSRPAQAEQCPAGHHWDATLKACVPDEVPPPPTGDYSKARGWYVPLYSDAMTQAVISLKQQAEFKNLPMLVAINPASGPGDVYTGSTGPRTDIQNRINQLNALPNIDIIGYIGSWYAGCLDNPPTGSQWPGTHNGVVYTMDRNQYNTLISQGKKAILVQDSIDKYAGYPVNGKVWYTGVQGLMVDEVYNGSNTAKQNWYTQLINYAKSRGMTVFKGNPGASVPTAYFTNGTWTNLSITEGSGFPTKSTLATLNKGQYANLCSFTRYGVPSVTRQQVFDVAPEVKYFFVTDDGQSTSPTPGNQYDNPPSYFVQVSRWMNEYNKSVGAY
jgi:hypothetical protein